MGDMDEKQKIPWFVKPTRPYIYGVIAGFGLGLMVATLIPPAAGYAGWNIFGMICGPALIATGSRLMWIEQRKSLSQEREKIFHPTH